MVAIHPAIQIGLGFCSILLVYVACEEVLRRILPRGIIGCLVMYVLSILMPMHLVVPLNLINMIFAFLLGLPGVILMYLVKIILWIV